MQGLIKIPRLTCLLVACLSVLLSACDSGSDAGTVSFLVSTPTPQVPPIPEEIISSIQLVVDETELSNLTSLWQRCHLGDSIACRSFNDRVKLKRRTAIAVANFRTQLEHGTFETPTCEEAKREWNKMVAEGEPVEFYWLVVYHSCPGTPIFPP